MRNMYKHFGCRAPRVHILLRGLCSLPKRVHWMPVKQLYNEKYINFDLGDVWCDEENSVWPKKPDNFTYKQVHLFNNEVGLWCIYVLMHEGTVAASSLSSKDLTKFWYRRADNEIILGKGYKKISKEYLEIKQKSSLFFKRC